MNTAEKKFLLLISFLVLGLGISLQIRTERAKLRQMADSQKYANFEQQLTFEKATSASVSKKIEDFSKWRENYIKSSTDNQQANLVSDLRNAKLKAGLLDVSGGGVIVTLKDSNKKVDNPNYALVHDSDVIRILNELWSGGAQAVAINDERMISVSEVVCTGPTVKVNMTRYTTPFEIKAIGNSDLLYSQVSDSAIVAELRTFGIIIDIQKFDKILIPGYKGLPEKLIVGLERVQ